VSAPTPAEQTWANYIQQRLDRVEREVQERFDTFRIWQDRISTTVMSLFPEVTSVRAEGREQVAAIRKVLEEVKVHQDQHESAMREQVAGIYTLIHEEKEAELRERQHRQAILNRWLMTICTLLIVVLVLLAGRMFGLI
jgi:Fe2+ transport system protein B